MVKLAGPIVGVWRFLELDEFEPDYIDMLEPGHLAIDPSGQGHFQFGVVGATLDARAFERQGVVGVEFSWEGLDEDHSINGRGTAVLANKDLLEGVLYFHLGDEFSFKARRTTRSALRSLQSSPQLQRSKKSRRR
jgi:hypothetical protein